MQERTFQRVSPKTGACQTNGTSGPYHWEKEVTQMAKKKAAKKPAAKKAAKKSSKKK